MLKENFDLCRVRSFELQAVCPTQDEAPPLAGKCKKSLRPCTFESAVRMRTKSHRTTRRWNVLDPKETGSVVIGESRSASATPAAVAMPSRRRRTMWSASSAAKSRSLRERAAARARSGGSPSRTRPCLCSKDGRSGGCPASRVRDWSSSRGTRDLIAVACRLRLRHGWRGAHLQEQLLNDRRRPLAFCVLSCG